MVDGRVLWHDVGQPFPLFHMRRTFFPTLFPTDLVGPSAAGAMLLFAAGGASAANHTRVVPFEVRCIVTDRENRPLEGVEVRLGLRSGPAGREIGGGAVFRTDAQGKHVTQLSGELTRGAVKRPTNFVDSLFSRKETTDDLQLAAELEYFGTRLLYVIKLHRFREERAVLHYRFSVYTRDERGNFTREVTQDKDGGWRFPGFGGLVLSDPGYRLAGGMFYPDEADPAGQRWILECRLMRSPDPVRR
jgi:hypothetical protein